VTTSSSNPMPQHGLDTMLLVYSFLPGHPAEMVCEQLLRSNTGWFTSPFVLVEAKNILTKVYRVDPISATAKLSQISAGPLDVLHLSHADIAASFRLADALGVDFTDATLLHLSSQHAVGSLATEDQRLAQACQGFRIKPMSPIDAALRQQVAAWEAAHVPLKGLPRVLRRIHQWLTQTYPQVAQDFWSQTAGGAHLP
jgi:predicted nucleic acid-binding protein